jgi:4-amino-4-deoxy-L-arabinose transferase-like glycosyltransferase
MSLYRTAGHAFWLVFSGRGLAQTPDSQWYINYAQGLLENFSIGLHVDEVLYLGYNLLLTLLLAVFKTTAAVVLVQSVVASLAIVLVYKIAAMLFNRTTAVLAGLCYLYIWDITFWSVHVLSDSFFVSLLLLCVYLLLQAMEPAQSNYRAFFAASSIYLCFFRPAGILIMGMLLLYIAIHIDRNKVVALLKKYKIALGAFLAVALCTIALLNFRHAFEPLICSFQYNAKLVLYNVYAKGWIYDKSTAYDYFFRPNYTVDLFDSVIISFLVNNWEAIGILYFRRAVAFLGTWAWETNFRNMGDVLYYGFKLIPLGLFITGTVAAIRNGKFAKASILWAIILAVFLFCILLFIDAMYRYRFPAMPFLCIVEAYGFDRLIAGGRLLAKHD